nr:acid alpha-amylase [Quercus suber]
MLLASFEKFLGCPRVRSRRTAVRQAISFTCSPSSFFYLVCASASNDIFIGGPMIAMRRYVVQAVSRAIVSHFALHCAFSFGASLKEWQGRSVYQVVTDRFAVTDVESDSTCAVVEGLYCGGSWQGIKQKLDYIQGMTAVTMPHCCLRLIMCAGMHFDAIWISPITGQLPQSTGDGEAYTGYWQQDLYLLNSKFGTKEDLIDLVNEVHRRGMFLMLDVVVNHMGYAGLPWLIDYAVLNPFNNKRYFHDYCAVDNSSPLNTEQCWLGDTVVPLADLRTEDDDVRQIYDHWISEMVTNYSIDGLRIDTAINVEPGFFPGFVDASGVFAMGEAWNEDSSVVCQWEKAIGSILNYPIFFALIEAFQNTTGSISGLAEQINAVKQNCNNPNAMGSFSENHDVPRFASYTNDMSLAKNVIAHTIMADGIPIIYQGQEQHMTGGISPYLNRAPLWNTGYDVTAPLYEYIATLNRFRRYVLDTSLNYTDYMAEVIYQDYHSIGFRKGFDGSQVIMLLNNNGDDQEDFELQILDHDFAADVVLTEVMTCSNVTVNETGYINLLMGAGLPKILYPAHLMPGSALCHATSIFPARASSVTASSTSSSYPASSTSASQSNQPRFLVDLSLLVSAAIVATAAEEALAAG